MKTKIFLALLLGTTVSLSAGENAQELLEKHCTTCHMTSSSTHTKSDKIIAPPMWGVMKKMRENFHNDDDAIKFLVEYSMHPSEDKMIFPEATKKYFGLMPSLKGKVPQEDLETIAKYLYR